MKLIIKATCIILIGTSISFLIYKNSAKKTEAQFGIAAGTARCIAGSALIGGATCVASAIIGIFTGVSCDPNYLIKEFVLDPAARCFAKAVYDETVEKLMSALQTSGRDGGPNFVRNYRNFRTEAQYRGEDVFRQILAQTSVCAYLRPGIDAAFGVTNSAAIGAGLGAVSGWSYSGPSPFVGNNVRVNDLNPFTLRGSCTLPAGFDVYSYANDFSGNGGWQAWNRLLEPQNNFISLYLMAQNELEAQRALEEQADYDEALAGDGFLATRDTCQDSQISGGAPSQARCTFLGNVFTPAQLLGQTAASTIDNDFGWLTSSDEISEIFVAITMALFNKVSNYLLGP